jgi:outer membrane murein-binding lipoprotein Lpp
MKKKKINKPKKSLNDNQVIVILEDMQSQFKVFGEGHKALSENTELLRHEVGVLAEDMKLFRQEVKDQFMAFGEGQDIIVQDVNILKSDVSGLKSDVATLKSDVLTLKSDVSTLKSDVSTLKGDVAEIKEDIKEINGKLDKKADVEDLKKLENEVGKVKKLVLARAT